MINMTFDLPQLLVGLGLAIVLALISYRFKALSISGALGTIAIGTLVFGLGGWLCAVPLLVFFITSSVLSRIRSEIKLQSIKTIEKAGPRDIKQVFANGGVATICLVVLLLINDDRWYVLYLASLGVAAADTWATEIGTLLSGKPVSIISWAKVPPGQSGGISLPGTIASLLGSMATVFSILPLDAIPGSFGFLLLASCAGFIGSLIDSFLGATVQAAYRCNLCGAIVESQSHCGQQSTRIKGISFINNDMVNFLSNLIAVGLLAFALFYGEP